MNALFEQIVQLWSRQSLVGRMVLDATGVETRIVFDVGVAGLHRVPEESLTHGRG